MDWKASIHWLYTCTDMAVCQKLVPLVNIKIAGKWMFIPLKMVLIGIDPYPYYISDTRPGKRLHNYGKIHHFIAG